jgi:hypothetical protein
MPRADSIDVRGPSFPMGVLPLLMLLAVGSAPSSGPALQAAEPPPDFERDVAPLLVQHCLECHHDGKASGGLNLSRRESTRAGGESGPALVAGHPDESYLLERIRAGEMPPPDEASAPHDRPREGIDPETVDRLAAWIRSGASWPDGRELGLHEQVVDVEQGRRFWSFQVVQRPPIPDPAGSAPSANPLDRFLHEKLVSAGILPNPPAAPEELLRRATLDLIGVPPSLEEQTAFYSDTSPDAWERLVSRLLAHPGYGERWGRHWLDLARYADSNGYERDGSKPSVWKYRDYVIRSLNDDKPYDRFVLEQLAGDELPDADAETLLAMGFYALGTWQDEVDPLEAPQYRADELDDLIRTTVQTFLGLTIGCARCHHHKFDPLSMVDYYSLAAILAPLQRPNVGRTDRDLPLGTRQELAALQRRDTRMAELDQQRQAWEAELKPGAQGDENRRGELRQQLSRLEEEIARLRRETPDLPRGYFLFEPAPPASPTYLLLSGRASQLGPEMQPRVPAVLAPRQPVFPPPDEHSTRRRITLARWIVDPENPLAARVVVNRVWQHHFGVGLVATPSDFGQIGARPTHPELLDWLAHWFMHDAEWSLKRLHFLIMTSEAYRRSSLWREEAAERDPENRLLWRQPARRLEAEPLRDSILAVSGALQSDMYGPGVFLPIPDAVVEAHTDKQAAWPTSTAPDIYRRSIYAYVKRTLLVPMMEVLDLCDTTQSTDQRSVTHIAPQALTLYNGRLVNEQAEVLARRLVREGGNDVERQVERAYRLTLARPPRPEERHAVLTFLQAETEAARAESVSGEVVRVDARPQAQAEETLGMPETDGTRHHDAEGPPWRALVQFCRVLLNLNEFAYRP